jgi:hypothetical protein
MADARVSSFPDIGSPIFVASHKSPEARLLNPSEPWYQKIRKKNLFYLGSYSTGLSLDFGQRSSNAAASETS